jgi:hypothetical protein
MRKPYQRLFLPVTVGGKWLRIVGALASVSFLLLVLLESMFSSIPAGAKNVLASDNFNRTVKSGWGRANTGG